LASVLNMLMDLNILKRWQHTGTACTTQRQATKAVRSVCCVSDNQVVFVHVPRRSLRTVARCVPESKLSRSLREKPADP
jgi:hypothetical protein